jgi:carbon-monoxide dehydrogenase medium subunit
MNAVEYAKPQSIDDAIRALTNAPAGARVLAGGTDLLVQLRAGHVRPPVIVDLKGIAELRRIEVTATGFRIGAAVAGAELGEHAQFAAEWPGVTEAFHLIGSTQIQGRATMGGNLCNASPAADSVPALIAAGAVLRVAGPAGERELAAEALQLGPGRHALAPGEVLVAIALPARAPRSGDAYLRLIPRTEMDIAVAGAGVWLALDADRRVSQARVALGAVAPTALRVDAAAQALIGSRLEDDALARLAAAASAACRPIDDKRGTAAYRTRVAGVLARRASAIAYERACA